MVPEVAGQRGFFTVIFAVILTAVEVLSYLMVALFMGLAFIVSPRGAHETLGSLGEGRKFDFFMSLTCVGLALVAAIGCRWMRRRINRTS